MATLVTNIQKWVGTAAERAAMSTTGVKAGSMFEETDTGLIYKWDGSDWFTSAKETVQLGANSGVDIGDVDVKSLTNSTHDNCNLNANIQVGDADVDSDNPVPAELVGSNTIKGAVKNVTTAGTREQLHADYDCREVTIIAKRANTGYIYVGGSDVSSSVYGAELAGKDSITIIVNNLNLIYIDSSVSGEGVSYVAV